LALVKPVIFQVVGYQNSGKTTFLLKIIHTLKKQGLTVVTIKHHGHGGKPDVVQKKDSSRHLEAGALAALVEGEGRLVLHAENSEWNLEEQLRLMEYFRPQVILIEGYKQERYPKLVLVKEKGDYLLLTKVNNIKAHIKLHKLHPTQ
jgi:molybdopterin-guanine dinucleotide biosynthesis protein B